MTNPLLKIEQLSVELGGNLILDKVSLSVEQGEIVAVVGASGSGKSTLLHAIAGFTSIGKGSVIIGGKSLSSLSEAELCRFRRTGFGLMTQDFHLLKKLSARRNVAVPQLMVGSKTDEALAHADELLSELGLKEHLETKSENLSRGQRQRVAFARSISTARPFLILDEPTSSLDHETSILLLKLVSKLGNNGTGVLLVTHDDSTIDIADRVYTLDGGKLSLQGDRK